MTENHEHTTGIGSILTGLMQKERPAGTGHGRAGGPRITSFGVPLIPEDDGGFLVDLTRVRVFSGLSGFAALLAQQVLEQCRRATTDALVSLSVDERTTPELAGAGIAGVVVYARSQVAQLLAGAADRFTAHLRRALDATQSPTWGRCLFAWPGEIESGTEQSEPLALLFPFHAARSEPAPYYILLESDRPGRFLRVTVELADTLRLSLRHIPHRVVKEDAGRLLQQDVPALAEQLLAGIHHACRNQRDEYTEVPGRRPGLFSQPATAGLPDIAAMTFRWTPDLAEVVLGTSSQDVLRHLAKLLALCGDSTLLGPLAAGAQVTVADGDTRSYLDVSRQGACLNISIGGRRRAPDMRAHLQRMPRLRQTLAAVPEFSLRNTRVLLIHHATTEVLGTVQALAELGCEAVHTLFIRYAGAMPADYVEDLFSLPAERFRFYSLQPVAQRDRVTSTHVLSRQYGTVSEDLERLDERLRTQRHGYLQAMRLVALHLFFREVALARAAGQRLLLVEDGGYVAPLVNEYCLENRRLESVWPGVGLPPPPRVEQDLPLSDWLAETVPVTFEHTTNGYDRLREVSERFGRLAVPAGTIAVSAYKNDAEAEACAAAVFHAVESVLNGLGRCLMYRNALVMGSSGHIGSYLLRTVADRCTRGGVWGLDLRAESHPAPVEVPQYRTLEELPEQVWSGLDLFVGMTGVSLIDREFMTRLLCRGRARDFFFASGSTKTVEYEGIMDWFSELATAQEPRIGDLPVRVESDAFQDPQSGMALGHLVRVTFLEGRQEGPAAGATRRVYLLADATPVNFLYYGVPTEVIDGVFSELLALVRGMLRGHDSGTRYAPIVHALDQNVDQDGHTLPGV